MSPESRTPADARQALDPLSRVIIEANASDALDSLQRAAQVAREAGLDGAADAFTRARTEAWRALGRMGQ